VITERHRDHSFPHWPTPCEWCGIESDDDTNPVCMESPLATIELTNGELRIAVKEFLGKRGIVIEDDKHRLVFTATHNTMNITTTTGAVARIEGIVLPERGPEGGPYR